VHRVDCGRHTPDHSELLATADVLGDVGLRNTGARRRILEVLDSSRALTAAEVFMACRAAGDRVGLSTVYRTLVTLGDAGHLHVFVDGHERRWCRCPLTHHHHVVCTDCWAVAAIEVTEAEEWVTEVARRAGVTPTRHDIDIYGRCRRCTPAA
jgi:Fur family transcriptional regulator, ferric uptake regulator